MKIIQILKGNVFFWVSAVFPFVWLTGGLLLLKNCDLPPWLEFFNSSKSGRAIFASVWLFSLFLHVVTRIPGIYLYLKRHFAQAEGEGEMRYMVISSTVLGFVLYSALYLIGFLTLFQVTGMLLTVCGLGSGDGGAAVSAQ